MEKIQKNLIFKNFGLFLAIFFGLISLQKLLTYAMIHYTPFATIYVKTIKIAMLAGVFSFMYCS